MISLEFKSRKTKKEKINIFNLMWTKGKNHETLHEKRRRHDYTYFPIMRIRLINHNLCSMMTHASDSADKQRKTPYEYFHDGSEPSTGWFYKCDARLNCNSDTFIITVLMEFLLICLWAILTAITFTNVVFPEYWSPTSVNSISKSEASD